MLKEKHNRHNSTLCIFKSPKIDILHTFYRKFFPLIHIRKHVKSDHFMNELMNNDRCYLEINQN